MSAGHLGGHHAAHPVPGAAVQGPGADQRRVVLELHVAGSGDHRAEAVTVGGRVQGDARGQEEVGDGAGGQRPL